MNRIKTQRKMPDLRVGVARLIHNTQQGLELTREEVKDLLCTLIAQDQGVGRAS
jgi:hypothetical protein